MFNEYSIKILWDLPDEESGKIVEDAAVAYVDLKITYRGSPGVYGGPSDGWEPPEAPEFEILSVSHDGKKITDIDIDELRPELIERIEEKVTDLLSEEDFVFDSFMVF